MLLHLLHKLQRNSTDGPKFIKTCNFQNIWCFYHKVWVLSMIDLIVHITTLPFPESRQFVSFLGSHVFSFFRIRPSSQKSGQEGSWVIGKLLWRESYQLEFKTPQREVSQCNSALLQTGTLVTRNIKWLLKVTQVARTQLRATSSILQHLSSIVCMTHSVG